MPGPFLDNTRLQSSQELFPILRPKDMNTLQELFRIGRAARLGDLPQALRAERALSINIDHRLTSRRTSRGERQAPLRLARSRSSDELRDAAS